MADMAELEREVKWARDQSKDAVTARTEVINSGKEKIILNL